MADITNQKSLMTGENNDNKRSAIDRLFRKYSDILTNSLSSRLGSREEASDVAQETFLRINKYDNVDEIDYPKALLYRIAGNIIKDNAKKNTRRKANEIESFQGDLTSNFESQTNASIAFKNVLLKQIILDLPPRCKQVFLLSRYMGMTYPEIAKHCKISESMVEKHIAKAMKICREKIGKEA